MSRTFISKFLVLGIPFIRRPISEPPANGTYVIVDNGEGDGWTDRQPASFKDGAWVPIKGQKLRFTPVFWSTLAGKDDG